MSILCNLNTWRYCSFILGQTIQHCWQLELHAHISHTHYTIQVFPQSWATAGPGAGPLCFREGIFVASRYPSLKCYGGVSPEWPRRYSFCFAVIVHIQLYTLSWVCWCLLFRQSDAFAVWVFHLSGPPTSLDSFGVSFCAFKQKQMNNYPITCWFAWPMTRFSMLRTIQKYRRFCRLVWFTDWD